MDAPCALAEERPVCLFPTVLEMLYTDPVFIVKSTSASEQLMKAYGFRLLYDCNLLSFIIPELCVCVGFDQRNPHHDKDVYEHILSVVEATPNDLTVRLAELFHDIAKPDTFTVDEQGIGHFYGHERESAYIAKKIMQRLQFDNKRIEDVFLLIANHLAFCEKRKTIKKLMNRVGQKNIDKLYHLMEGDIKGHKPPYNFDKLHIMIGRTKELVETQHPLSVKDLSINGYDLSVIGIEKGKAMGSILAALLEKVLEDPSLNTKEKLLNIVKRNGC
ncbi:HD domain-containing protein [Aneurinibacillus migulanus]|uniref:tRNA nucleotidyltransferase domain 2 putative n=1 Tax=Aneurinibacillus migulanus TaxID=47500 RepID=A0A1G8IK34_ANEMI|nr:HD domain-containing protein [Aneurinibacillus migulanus]MED0892430.1 HD domain-containing protein [Aneurinibacillus migulanus]MED1615617.1 HD domain-containing protein [Aneurinibacillus migulanus]GED15207.1 hypothetical protein AMI01nite_31980 [Aneurinibacillus migulanus]SDI19316.1 tRNA nucleotidyltransferase domain 2 putative [Aneurinibacillus migulanus]